MLHVLIGKQGSSVLEGRLEGAGRKSPAEKPEPAGRAERKTDKMIIPGEDFMLRLPVPGSTLRPQLEKRGQVETPLTFLQLFTEIHDHDLLKVPEVVNVDEPFL